VVESAVPGAPVDGRRAQHAVPEVGHADHQARVERVFKPDPDAVLAAVAEVAAGVDDEPCQPGAFDDRRDDVDEVALAGRSDINHQRTLGDEGRAIPDDVRCPARPCPSAFCGAHRGRGGLEGIGRVVAEELELAADQRVHGAVGGRDEAVVEVEQGDRVSGELEPSPGGGGGDLGHERVRSEAGVGAVEAPDPVQDPVAHLAAQRLVGVDAPAGADGVEGEVRPYGRRR
jgi:hypothetical protein